MRAAERERGCHRRDGVGGRGKAGVAGAMLRYLSSITLSSATKFPHLCSHNYNKTYSTHTHTHMQPHTQALPLVASGRQVGTAIDLKCRSMHTEKF